MAGIRSRQQKHIPFIDLKRQHESIREEIDAAIQRVINNSSFSLGEEVELFETEFADFCEAKYGVGVSSGTDALHLALLACGVGEGDEVITVPNTFIATTEAISMCGARPVFVDIDEETYNIDVNQIESAITGETKAIVPVHLYGQPAEIDTILEIARNHRLKVIEDACQAHGAIYKGKKVGVWGDAGCFSFYPSKNLGACGDGGIVITNNRQTAEQVKRLRHHGHRNKSIHEVEGFCNRLHGLQAAILRVKLRYLDDWNQMRKRNAEMYGQLLEGNGQAIPKSCNGNDHVYHLYVIRLRNRDVLRERLAEMNIDSGIHYPVPLHVQPAYKRLGYRSGDFPVTEKVTQEIVSLPMYPELTRDEIECTAGGIIDFAAC
jgi:dTDP-4-amino-4,6-dideoxygalactose transaminase